MKKVLAILLIGSSFYAQARTCDSLPPVVCYGGKLFYLKSCTNYEATAQPSYASAIENGTIANCK